MAAPDEIAGELEGVRVLVVDDDPENLEVSAILLARAGAQVLCVDTAEAALAAIETFAPDALVSDIAMPGVSGIVLVQQIRARGDAQAWLPAIALTAHARPEILRAAIAQGFDATLTKPVETSQLVAAIREAVDARRRPAAS